MDFTKIKGYINKNKKMCGIGAIVAVVLIASLGAYLAFGSSEKLLKLKKMDFIFELGEKMNNSPEFYLDTEKLSKEDKDAVLTKTKVTLPKKYDKTGKYDVKLSYKNDNVTAKVEVVDSVAPSFEAVDNMTVPLGTKYTDEQFKEMFKVTDADKVKLTIDNGGYNGDAEGTYTISAEAKDKTGNSTKYSFTITVTATVTEIQYSENTAQAESSVKEDKKTTSNKSDKNNTGGNNNGGSNTSGGNNSGNTGNSGNNGNTGNGGNNPVYVKSVSISGNNSSKTYSSITLTANVNPSNATGLGYGSYKWTTNSANCQIVCGQGLASADFYSTVAGTYTVTCTVQGVSTSYNITFKEEENKPQTEVDFNKVKVRIKKNNGQEIVKGAKELNFSQNGNSATANITLGSGDWGLVWNDNPGYEGTMACGIIVEEDESMWYPSNPGPTSFSTKFFNNIYAEYKSYSGYTLRININIGSPNTNFNKMLEIIHGQ